LYNRVYKNYEINVGAPFEVEAACNFHRYADRVNDSQEAAAPDGDSAQELVDEREAILAKAREESESMLEEARSQALSIIDGAKKEAEEIKCRAEEEARRRGYEAGYNEGKSQYEALIREAEEIKARAEEEYARLLAGIETDAVNMILDIAKKVIGAELKQNKESILHLVRQAFEKCTNKERLVLKVSPEDYDFVNENKDKLLSMLGGAEEIEIKKDSSLCSGGCIVDTPFGSIDASAQTRLAMIEEAFAQAGNG